MTTRRTSGYGYAAREVRVGMILETAMHGDVTVEEVAWRRGQGVVFFTRASDGYSGPALVPGDGDYVYRVRYAPSPSASDVEAERLVGGVAREFPFVTREV